MHLFSNSYIFFFMALATLVASMALWFRDIVSEGRSSITYYNLNIAKAIPVEEINKVLIDYKNNNNIYVFTDKDNLGYYLAGLLEGDGHISLPSLGNTTLNRVLNPRIVFTSHKENLGMSSPVTQKIEHVNTALSFYRQHIKEISTKDILPLYMYSIFIGLLLSSGWANIHNKTQEKARIKFCQPYENKDYIYHVFREIFVYCEKDPYRFVSNRVFKGKPVDNLLITTRWMYCFINIYHMFYNKNGKIVPNNIYDILTPLVLAHWVMSSGFRLQGRGLILYTNYFNTVDVVKLINVLIIKYRLQCKLLFVKNKPCIYIPRNYLGNLIINIKPYILSSTLKILLRSTNCYT